MSCCDRTVQNFAKRNIYLFDNYYASPLLAFSSDWKRRAMILQWLSEKQKSWRRQAYAYRERDERKRKRLIMLQLMVFRCVNGMITSLLQWPALSLVYTPQTQWNNIMVSRRRKLMFSDHLQNALYISVTSQANHASLIGIQKLLTMLLLSLNSYLLKVHILTW